MIRCRIFDEDTQLLKEFECDESVYGPSISVGSSDKAAVSLPGTGNLEPVHFALVRKGNSWFLENPGNDVSLINGHTVESMEVTDGIEVTFASLTMRAEEEREESPYHLVWGARAENMACRAPLYNGTNRIGSAHYSDIVIDSELCAPEQAEILVDGDSCIMQPLDGTVPVIIAGREISGRTPVSPGQLFYFDTIPLKIIDGNLPDSAISLVPGRINWRLLNVFLFLVAAALSVMLVLFKFISPQTKGVSAGATEVLAAGQYASQIADAVKKGLPEEAEATLLKLKKYYKKSTLPADIADALKEEMKGVRLLRFYNMKMDVTDKNLNTLPFLRQIFNSPDAGEQLEIEKKYWTDVEKRINRLAAEIKRHAEPRFLEMHTHSYFMSEYPGLMKRLCAIRELYSDFAEMNKAWNDGQWKEFVSLLHRVYPDSDTVQSSEMVRYINSLVKCAKFAEKVSSYYAEFANLDYPSTEIPSIHKKAVLLVSELNDFLKYDSFPVGKIEKQLKQLTDSSGALMKMDTLLARWEKDRDDFNKFNKLAELLNLKAFTGSEFSVINKARRCVQEKLHAYIYDAAGKIKPLPDRALLKQCDRLEDLLIAAGISSSTAGTKLDNTRRKINFAINRKCNSLYNQFQMKKAKGDFSSLKPLAEQIYETASEGSHYYKWADDTLKRLK